MCSSDLLLATLSSPNELHDQRLLSRLENPMDRGAWQATVHGITKSWTSLNQKNNYYSQRGQIEVWWGGAVCGQKLKQFGERAF